MLVDQGARRVVGVDKDRKIIEEARGHQIYPYSSIDYFVCDVADMGLKPCFDIATGIYSLHYAKTEDILSRFIKNISESLKEESPFVGVILDPRNPVQKDKKYGIINHVTGDVTNGCEVIVTLYDQREDGNVNALELPSCYYWDTETYQKMFKEAGFRDLEWIPPIISPEGKARFGDEFWKQYITQPGTIMKATKKLKGE